ncbi:hypothetical protein [Nereida sp. MMG025]|uniref:hypothetical protein n=1 Tax=Nereida sp. MMG025 TaxID=2909981 RepID=UPI001F40C1A1|nr:hypothetical protein [Nereida sp. MMG025]MCF6445703.1 hypothetical protein [Nereida sp. MMG025]
MKIKDIKTLHRVSAEALEVALTADKYVQISNLDIYAALNRCFLHFQLFVTDNKDEIWDQIEGEMTFIVNKTYKRYFLGACQIFRDHDGILQAAAEKIDDLETITAQAVQLEEFSKQFMGLDDPPQHPERKKMRILLHEFLERLSRAVDIASEHDREQQAKIREDIVENGSFRERATFVVRHIYNQADGKILAAIAAGVISAFVSAISPVSGFIGPPSFQSLVVGLFIACVVWWTLRLPYYRRIVSTLVFGFLGIQAVSNLQASGVLSLGQIGDVSVEWLNQNDIQVISVVGLIAVCAMIADYFDSRK